jgi:hypothetical protein
METNTIETAMRTILNSLTFAGMISCIAIALYDHFKKEPQQTTE